MLIYIFLIILFLSKSSHAYIGPGMSGGFIATLIGIIIALLAPIIAFIYFPLKRFINSRKRKKSKSSQNK